jgi:hypothetical protein
MFIITQVPHATHTQVHLILLSKAHSLKLAENVDVLFQGPRIAKTELFCLKGPVLHLVTLLTSKLDEDEYGTFVESYGQGRTRVLGAKSQSVPCCQWK